MFTFLPKEWILLHKSRQIIWVKNVSVIFIYSIYLFYLAHSVIILILKRFQ